MQLTSVVMKDIYTFMELQVKTVASMEELLPEPGLKRGRVV